MSYCFELLVLQVEPQPHFYFCPVTIGVFWLNPQMNLENENLVVADLSRHFQMFQLYPRRIDSEGMTMADVYPVRPFCLSSLRG